MIKRTTQRAFYFAIGSDMASALPPLTRTALRRCRRTSFLLHFNKIDEDVLGPQAWAFDEVGGDAREDPPYFYARPPCIIAAKTHSRMIHRRRFLVAGTAALSCSAGFAQGQAPMTHIALHRGIFSPADHHTWHKNF